MVCVRAIVGWWNGGGRSWADGAGEGDLHRVVKLVHGAEVPLDELRVELEDAHATLLHVGERANINQRLELIGGQWGRARLPSCAQGSQLLDSRALVARFKFAVGGEMAQIERPAHILREKGRASLEHAPPARGAHPDGLEAWGGTLVQRSGMAGVGGAGQEGWQGWGAQRAPSLLAVDGHVRAERQVVREREVLWEGRDAQDGRVMMREEQPEGVNGGIEESLLLGAA